MDKYYDINKKKNLSKIEREQELENLEELLTNSNVNQNRKLINVLDNYKKLLKYNSQYGLRWDEHLEQYDALKSTNAFWFDNYQKGKWDIKPKKDGTYDNLLLIGDNYASMNLMLKTHRNKVDVIYTDPPYNTGSDDFNYQDGWTKTEWADMIYKRMKLCRELLKDDGVIFISIDDNSLEDLKMIMNQVFGVENFVSQIIWVRNLGGKSDAKYFAQTSEYILVYSKTSRLILNKVKTKLDISKLNIDVENNLAWKKGPMLEKGGGADTLFERKNLGYVVYYHPQHQQMILKDDYHKDLSPNSTPEDVYTFSQELIDQGFVPIIPRTLKNNICGCWRMGKDKLNQLFNSGLVIFEKNKNNQYKIFTKEVYDLNELVKYQVPKNLIDFTSSSTGTNNFKTLNIQSGDFSFPKPTDLIEYLINFHPNKNAIVFDPFMGSGTTGQAVMELNKEDGGNRKFIGCQLEESSTDGGKTWNNVSEITCERISKVIGNIEKFNTTFKVLQLTDKNVIDEYDGYFEDLGKFKGWNSIINWDNWNILNKQVNDNEIDKNNWYGNEIKKVG